MNAGLSYHKAKQQAQANADLDKAPRYLHSWNSMYWISKTPVNNGERIDPKKEKKP